MWGVGESGHWVRELGLVGGFPKKSLFARLTPKSVTDHNCGGLVEVAPKPAVQKGTFKGYRGTEREVGMVQKMAWVM